MTALATRADWQAAMQRERREHEHDMRNRLGQSLRQYNERVRDALGRFGSETARAGHDRWTALKKAAVEEKGTPFARQGMHLLAGAGTAVLAGAARGFAGNEAFTVAGMPLELATGIGAHVAALALVGTSAGSYAQTVGTTLIAAGVAQLSQQFGAQARARLDARRAQGHATAGYAPPGYALAGTSAADRAMAEAIELMRSDPPLPVR